VSEATPFGLTSSNGKWNIDIDSQGSLAFNANDDSGGDTRMVINDDTGQIMVGGAGVYGHLQLVGPDREATIYIGADDTSATAVLGGADSRLAGQLFIANAANLRTIDMQGSGGNIKLGADPSGIAPGQDGDLSVRDGHGGVSIQLTGSTGSIRAVSVTETSDRRFKAGIVPLSNALNTVLALRGVRYQWKQDGALKQGFSQDAQLGFIGQEVEIVCPEVVSTDAEGYKSLHYSRLTPVLVEAMKEQQQLITQQAAALGAALARIAQLEASLQEVRA
jgi:hypothetical protein